VTFAACRNFAWRIGSNELVGLINGDLEEPPIELLIDRHHDTSTLDVDVYEVGYHGSHNGTTPELLAAMTPKMAVISCGRWDFGKPAKKKEKPKQLTTFAFGHPRRSTIDMLVLAIPGEREQATKQVVFDAVHKKPPYAEFRKPTIRKRIYATAWDGTIEIQADLQGAYTVRFSEN